MAGIFSRRALLPGLLALILSLAAGTALVHKLRPPAVPAPAIPSPRGSAPPVWTPSPLHFPTPTSTPAAAPAGLHARIVRIDGREVVARRSIWAASGGEVSTFPISTGDVLDASLPPGEYSLGLEAGDGLCLETPTLRLESGKVVFATLHLIPTVSLEVFIQANVRPGIPRDACLSRELVRHESNQALQRAQPDETFPADADGHVRLDHLLAGVRYALTARATAFLEQKREIVAGDVEAVTFYLNAGGVIAGQVVYEATGGPVDDLLLNLWGLGVEPAETATDASGCFVLEGLGPGEYNIDVADTGFGPLADSGTPMPIILRLGEHREDVRLYLGPGGSIRARLIDAKTGEPFSTDKLQVRSMIASTVSKHGLCAVVLTAPEGRVEAQSMIGSGAATNELRFTHLAPGDYLVQLEAGRDFLANQTRCASVEGTGETLVDFRVWDGRSISGTVVDSAGDAVAGATVTTDSGKQAEAISTATGYFQVQGLDLRTCMLIAECTGYAPGYAPNIAAGQQDVIVRLSRGGALEGLILDRDGAPVADVEVTRSQENWLGAPDSVHESVASDDRGRFGWEHLPAGCHALQWNTGSDGRRLVEIREGETTRVVLGGGAALVGTVTVNGRAAEGFKVAYLSQPMAMKYGGWVSLDREEVRQTETACDLYGAYRLAGLPPRRHGWIAVAHDDMKFAYLLEVEFPREGEKTLDIEFDTGTLAGRVVDEEGSGVAGCSVDLVPAHLGSAPACAYLTIVDMAVLFGGAPSTNTDAGGRFQFDDLPPGEYVLFSESGTPGFAPQRIKFKPSADNRDVELRGEAPGVLEGRVYFPGERNDVGLCARNRDGLPVFEDSISVDAHGIYNSKLPPGVYDVNLIGEENGASWMSETAHRVVITSGASMRRDFTLKPVCLVMAQMWDGETGAAVGGFAGSLRPLGGGRLEKCGVLTELFNMMVIVSPPGRYALTVQHPDYRTETVEFEVQGPGFHEAPDLVVPVRLQRR